MKQLIIIFIFLLGYTAIAQVGGKLPPLQAPGGIIGNGVLNDSLQNNKRTKKSEVVYPIKDYKKFSLKNDSIAVDTLLSIRNFYKINYTLEDDFELLPFQNMGHPFTFLSSSFIEKQNELQPDFVALAKEFNTWNKNQVPFFYVPTTYSDLFYLNGINKGQMLQAFITSNINPQLNFAVGYKGISSLGFYQNSLSSLGRFFISSNFHTKNKRYYSKVFYVSHDLQNQENGGLKDKNQFESGNPDFYNRSRVEVQFTDAEIKTFSSEFFWQQEYQLFAKKSIYLQNNFDLNNKKYIFNQRAPSGFIGDAFTSSEIKDSTRLNRFENELSVKFKHKKIKIQTGLGYIYNHYQWDSIKNINNQVIPRELLYKDIKWASSAKWNSRLLDINLHSEIIPTGNLKGYKLDGELIYKKDSLKGVSASFLSSSRKPDFKFLLFQSAYKKLNWYHPEFENVHLQNLRVILYHKNYGQLIFKQEAINNYTYFGQDLLPHQYPGLIAISSLKLKNDFLWRKIGWSSDLLYQNVVKGNQIISLPKLVVRESLFYTDRFFKKHLQVQTGFTFKYFTSYYAMGYHPVLGDYFMQNDQKIGDFPLLDFFFNFKVKRFRFYFKAEHFNALWERKAPKYYAAPGYPMRDFSLRFGINWVFFN